MMQLPTMSQLEGHIFAAPQVSPQDLPSLSEAGFTAIVNHRPDHEEGGQPTNADMESAARAAGLDYVHLPVSGMPSPDVVAGTAQALESARDGRILMFCRSGMRSTAAWAMARRAAGADPGALRQAAAAAGYDLGRLPL